MSTTINPNVNSATSGQAAQVQSRIISQTEVIKGLAGQLSALLLQLEALRDAKPERPDTSGMDEKDAKRAMSKFESDMRKWENDVSRMNGQIQTVQDKMDKAEKELQKLMNQDLPNAQRADAEKARKEIEEMRKQLEESVRGFDNVDEDRIDSGAQSARAEIKAQVNRNEDGFARVSLEVTPPQGAPNPDAGMTTGRTMPAPTGTGMPPVGIP